jgi:hypothetical protein
MVTLCILVIFILNSKSIFLLIIIPTLFFINAIEAYYFEITEDELIIKNYMLPFLKKRYKLSEITQVQFLEMNYRSPTKAQVKVIQQDKQSMRFKATSLSIPDWKLLVNDLHERKIPVKIEAYSLKETIGIPEE